MLFGTFVVWRHYPDLLPRHFHDTPTTRPSVHILSLSWTLLLFFPSAWIYLFWAFSRNENLEKCESWCLPSLAEWFKSQPRCSMCWLFFYCPNTASAVGCTIFSRVGECLDSPYLWNTVNKAVATVSSYKCLWEVLLSFLRSVYLETGSLAHMVMLCLTFWTIANILRILFRNQPWWPISKHGLHPTVKPGVIFWR